MKNSGSIAHIIMEVRQILIDEFGHNRGTYITGSMATTIFNYAADDFEPVDIIAHLKNSGAFELGAHLSPTDEICVQFERECG